jgi:primosomal protein N' (replication factor Y)
MKARFYCTYYSAIKAMLPTGIWFRDSADSQKRPERRIKEKTVKIASLAISAEEAADYVTRSANHRAILKFLAESGETSVEDICYFTGVTAASLNALAKRGVISLEPREVLRRPKVSEITTPTVTELSPEQAKAYSELSPLLESGKPEAALLYGVTGSGKTSVYIKLINAALEHNRGAIVLVPEIALTPQFTALFSKHFGERVAVLHSSLSVGERYDEWRRIRAGDAVVVVGTRSAVFAPVHRLGIIIIDEEQEQTYQSDSVPRYNAQDIAKFRCVQRKAMLLLGSATPSIESMLAAKTGRYRLSVLPARYNTKPLPKVIIADMKRELKEGGGGALSQTLRTEVEKNLERGEQSILFINRRGANAIVACPECGKTFTCPDCSVNLTYHTANRRLMCHYCGYSEPLPPRCPQCNGILKFIGTGTQKVEDEFHLVFPGVSTLRMDTDTINAANPHEALLKKFSDDKIPVLIGTQMITKGLNFPNVTLVGVINPDNSLYAGYYRAQERTFALITQVVGRAGRGDKDGRAVIQTFTPQNEVIRFAAAQDYDAFYEREIHLRQLSGAPPFAELHCAAVSGMDEDLVILCAKEIRDALTDAFPAASGVRILGPTAAPVVKVSNRFRYRVFAAHKSADARFRAVFADVIRKFASDNRFRKLAVAGINGAFDS